MLISRPYLPYTLSILTVLFTRCALTVAMARNNSVPLALAILMIACVAVSAHAEADENRASKAPLKNTTGVACTVAPCDTPACKTKCIGQYGSNARCVDNYTTGCNCDCLPPTPRCVPAKALCAVGNSTDKCCGNNLCDLANICVTNPLTDCGTVCIPKEDSFRYCKKRNTKCDPKKVQCCNGTDCRLKAGLKWYSKNKQYTCQKCKRYGESCIIGNSECCGPLTSCQNPRTSKKGEKGNCEIVSE